MASKAALWVTIGLATLGLILLFGGFMAWTGLGLPFAKLEPMKLPEFFWYYRHDRRVIKWLVIGMAIATALLRWTTTPAKHFTRTAITLTAVSLLAPLLSGGDAATTITLITLHLIAAAVMIPALTRAVRRRP